MDRRPDDFCFAAVGDVHGHMNRMVRLVQERAARARRVPAFVLQVGDFEPHRHETDLASMSAPAKYRHLGDFPAYHAGRARFPWPVYFIGGNHEPHGFLEPQPDGFELVPHCRYLGRVGVVEMNGLRVVGLSGIHREERFHRAGRRARAGPRAGRRAAAARLARGNHRRGRRARLRVPAPESQPRRRGQNAYARLLVDALRPRLVLCGHLHKSYRGIVSHPTGELTWVCCLDEVAQGPDSAALFQVSGGSLREHTG